MSLKVSSSQSHKKMKEGELSAASLASFNPDTSSADEIKAKLRAWHSRVKTGKVKESEDQTKPNQDTHSSKVPHAMSHQVLTPLANIPLPQPIHSPASLLGPPTALSSTAVIPQNISQMFNDQLMASKKPFPDTTYCSADFTGPLSLSEILRRKKRTQETDKRPTTLPFEASKPPTPLFQPLTPQSEGTPQDLSKRQMTSSDGHYVTFGSKKITTPATQDPCGVTSLEKSLPTPPLDNWSLSLDNSFSVNTAMPETLNHDLPNLNSVKSINVSDSKKSIHSNDEPLPTKPQDVMTNQYNNSIDSHQLFTSQFPSAPQQEHMKKDYTHEPWLPPSDVASHVDNSDQTLPPVPTYVETSALENTLVVKSHGAPSSPVDRLQTCEPFFMFTHHEIGSPLSNVVITGEKNIRSSSCQILSNSSPQVPQLNEEKETNDILQNVSCPLTSSCHQNPEMLIETSPLTFHNSDPSSPVDHSKNNPTPQIQTALYQESLDHQDKASSRDNAFSDHSAVLESLGSEYSSLHPSVKDFLNIAGPETFSNYLYIIKCIAKQTTPEQFQWIQKALNQETPQQDSHQSESSQKRNIPLSVGRSILKILLSTIKECALLPPHKISSPTQNLNDPNTGTTSSDPFEHSASVS